MLDAWRIRTALEVRCRPKSPTIVIVWDWRRLFLALFVPFAA